MVSDEIPAQLMVDTLRNEIARLNDERITLAIKLQHAYDTIANLGKRLEGTPDEGEEPEPLAD